MIYAVFYWLSERLRSAVLWPINLVRDFPLRLGRLGQTLWLGLRGLFLFLPHWATAVDKKAHLRQQGRYLGVGLYRLITQLFDLIGGPELAAFLLQFGAHTTPLTPQEIAFATAVFGPQMRYKEIRITQGGWFDYIFQKNGNLAFATWRSINIPRTGRHTRDNHALLMHELTHVYQYERVGSRYLGEAIYMLVKTKRDCYNYGGVAGLQTACEQGQTYAHLNREQQAMLVQDYFALNQKGVNTAVYEPFIAQLQQGQI